MSPEKQGVKQSIHAQVVGQPCWQFDILLVATINAHTVGRTVDGLGGVGNIVDVEGCRIDQVGYAARRRHARQGKAPGAIWVAACWIAGHNCNQKEIP